MKPDGVATAALEPMETLESNPVNEAAPPTGQELNPAASPVEEEMPQQPVGEVSQAEPLPAQPKETPAAKTSSKATGDVKAKTTNKVTIKTKTSSTSLPKTSSGPRSTTSQSRISNGTSKPQTNGVAKKATPSAEKKSAPLAAPSKKAAATTAGALAPKSTTKVGEKKATGVSPYLSGTKTSTGGPAAKKTPSTTANGVKPSPTASAAKKPPAPKPASTSPTKTTAAASTKPDKPPVSKTTRPTVSTAASSRPATGSSHTASTTKNSTAASKTAAPKTSSITAKPPTPKSTSTAPSGGKTPVSQTSRNTTPVKKDSGTLSSKGNTNVLSSENITLDHSAAVPDLTKPATPAGKKPADSPLSRPSPTTKPAKAETPKPSLKTNVATKKPTTPKAAETKTPSRPKTQESKSTPSKDASKTPTTKTNKTPSSKKTVGSSTPTPVKRAPKAATPAEPGKEVAAAAVAVAAATIATAAFVAAAPEEPHAEEAAPSAAVPEAVPEQTPEPTVQLVSEPVCEPAQDLKLPPVSQSLQETTPEPVRVPTPEPLRVPTPEPVRVPTPEPVRVPTPEPMRVPTPEPMRVPTPEPVRVPTPEPVRVPTPEPMRVPTPEPMRVPTPELMRVPTPDPVRVPTPEPVRVPTPEPVRVPTPEPVREPTPEMIQVPSPSPMWEPVIQPVHEPSSVHVLESFPEPRVKMFEPSAQAEPEPDLASSVQISTRTEALKLEDDSSVPSLGTTVMSPPCSPPGLASPVREPQNSLLEMDAQFDPWDRNQACAELPSKSSDSFMRFQAEEEKENKSYGFQEEEEEDDKENMFLPTSIASGVQLGASPLDHFTRGDLVPPQEKEEAVEKADEEINEDEEEDEEEDEDEEQKRPDHHLSSLITDMSTSQPSDEIPVRLSAFGGSAGWPGDDLLSGMDSEDVSSCTSSRQQGVSDLSSTQHTAILEGTQSSDALIDSSFRGSEGDGNLMGSPNVETIANEEEEDEDEEDDRVDDMDMSSEQVEEHHAMFQKQDEEEDDDVEMHSEGVTGSCENVDEDFNHEEHVDHLSRSGPPPCAPPASSWGHTNPFCDTWAQPASLLPASSPSPTSDHDAAESETPTQSPAQACVDVTTPSFPPQSEQAPHQLHSEEVKVSAPEEAHDLLAAPAVGMSQSSTLSGTALAALSSSETSTPEDLRDYDSSSGVESHSDKQQTPIPASVQPDMEQDLGIHLEKGDGEEEEAETLPADEVLGTGPPTAPASDPSSPSTSGDEASDTEGEIQINDPEAPILMDGRAGFESPPPSSSLTALEEDEEAGDTAGGEGEEDGGGATPQSANSVASYGFDCTMSNSNAHSMAESCGKSPGIFSLENEEQLPEEAKDPSLIKELTLPSTAAAAQGEDLLGNPVDLIPLGHPEDKYPSLDHYMLGGKIAGAHLEEFDPLECSQHLGGQESEDPDDNQPPYYSTICDKTDSFLEGDEKSPAVDEDHQWHSRSQEDNWNQNHTTAVPVANGHYLALVPGNRRPIDLTLAEHFAKFAPPPPLVRSSGAGEEPRRPEQHQEELRAVQHRQEQERQKRQWLEEERLRLEQQKQLEKQRRELLQLQLQQQQQEHRHRRQVLQWQLELEHQYRMQQKQIQQQQQLRRSPTGVMLSPSSGLCTIYEAMETSEEEDEAGGEPNKNTQVGGQRGRASQDSRVQLRPVPPQELEWNKKVDMVQQLINQTLMLSGDGGCPPLLLLPVGPGGSLSPLESSMWPNLPPQFSPPAATVISVSSYSPDSRVSSPPEDWTVVEVETQH